MPLNPLTADGLERPPSEFSNTGTMLVEPGRIEPHAPADARGKSRDRRCVGLGKRLQDRVHDAVRNPRGVQRRSPNRSRTRADPPCEFADDAIPLREPPGIRRKIRVIRE